MKNPELVIMAAGMGSRYGGLKQIDSVDEQGHIIIDFSIYDAIKAGFRDVTFIIKKEIEKEFREVMDKHLAGKNINVKYVFQELYKLPEGYSVPDCRKKPWGTAHALMCCLDTVDAPFAVINADDYYGSEAFGELYHKLNSLNPGEATMVAYKLKNTVSRNGSVSRGVCKVENGKLCTVREHYDITIDENDIISDKTEGVLPSDSLVSMNLWGFLPTFFDDAKIYFDEFLKTLSEGELKKECALPTMVDTQIQKGALEVSVLSTDSVWFGVTYKEDKDYVAGELLKMHKECKYPEKL